MYEAGNLSREFFKIFILDKESIKISLDTINFFTMIN